MGTALSVKVDGSWETIDEPYIRADDNWKTVHNIWVKNGGTWQLAHKTAYDQYQEFTSETGIQRNDSITIAAGVRYLRIVLGASGGGAGGGCATSGSWAAGHATCPLVLYNFNYSLDHVAGGNGGAGGLAVAVLEVKEGETYSWTWAGGGSGGGVGTTLHLAHNVVYSVGTSSSGASGATAGNVIFSGPNNTDIRAFGGVGGGGGTVTVASVCTTSGFQGQSVSTSNSAGGIGTSSFNGDKIISSTGTTGGGGDGGTGNPNGSGFNGDSVSIEIHQYRASQI